MPIYNCKLCDFKSSNKMNYSKHTKTKKHLQKVDQPTTVNHQLSNTCATIRHQSLTNFECKYCDNIYKSQSSR